jgi:hypothetical protein
VSFEMYHTTLVNVVNRVALRIVILFLALIPMAYASDPCGGGSAVACDACPESYGCPTNCTSPSEQVSFAGGIIGVSCSDAPIPPSTECGPTQNCTTGNPPLPCRLRQITLTVCCVDGTTKYYFKKRCCATVPT